MSTLGTAIKIAAEAFENVRDRGGKPYILHCLHVMNKLKYESDEELMIIAVLHDLIEDTDWEDFDLLALGFSNRVVNALECLTHNEGESYDSYIHRVSCNTDAVKVKLQDLRHNSDITRIKGVRKKDIERIEKYHKAYQLLKDKLED